MSTLGGYHDEYGGYHEYSGGVQDTGVSIQIQLFFHSSSIVFPMTFPHINHDISQVYS